MPTPTSPRRVVTLTAWTWSRTVRPEDHSTGITRLRLVGDFKPPGDLRAGRVSAIAFTKHGRFFSEDGETEYKLVGQPEELQRVYQEELMHLLTRADYPHMLRLDDAALVEFCQQDPVPSADELVLYLTPLSLVEHAPQIKELLCPLSPASPNA